MIEFFDSHTHVHFPAYNKDRDELIKKTLQEGVGFVNVGTNKETSKKAIKLAEKYKNNPIYATIGLHPIHTSPSNFHDKNESLEKNNSSAGGEEFNINSYKKLGLNKKVVAIGECGFDFFHSYSDEIKEKQEKALIEQIKLSNQINKPLMIHCRPSKNTMNAYDYFYKIISKTNKKDVIMHFFAGNKKIAKKFIDLGFYFTFGGVITLTKDYDEIIKMIPKNKILLETDAPYVAPLRYRNQRNQPLYVKGVYKKITKLLEMNEDELKQQVLENNEKIFGISLKS